MTQTIAIANMTCGGCAKAVAHVIGDVDPGATHAVDLERNLVTVQSAADPAALLAALRQAGWDARAA